MNKIFVLLFSFFVFYVHADFSKDDYRKIGVKYEYEISEYYEAGISPEDLKRFLEIEFPIYSNVIFYIQEKVDPSYAKKLEGLGLISSDIVRLYELGVEYERVKKYIDVGAFGYEIIDIESRSEFDLGFHELSNKSLCDQYPPENIKFIRMEDLDDLPLEEPVQIPVELYKVLRNNSYDAFTTDPEERSILFDEVAQSVSGLENPTISDLVFHAAELVSSKINYAEVDDDTAFQDQFPEGCSIYKYWSAGVGDCDKYASLAIAVFTSLKKLYPKVLSNVYMMGDLFGIDEDHAWNTLLVLTKDERGGHELVISYNDPTFYDGTSRGVGKAYRYIYEHGLKLIDWINGKERKNNEYNLIWLDALDSGHFDKDYFLDNYKNRFCVKPSGE